MRPLLSKLALFIVIQMAVLAAVIALYQVDHSGFLASTHDKRARLAKLSSPKVILVGGSAVAFGFDSPAIERSVGMPVVNMGLQGSLGLTIKLREVEPFVGPGDVVILSLEYQHYAGQILEGLTLWGYIEQRPGVLGDLGFRELKVLADSGQLYLRNLATGAARVLVLGQGIHAHPPYTRRSQNAWGDVIAQDTVPHPGLGDLEFHLRPFSERKVDAAMEALRELNHHAQDVGATVYIYFPPLPRGRIAPADEARLLDLEQRLASATSIVRLNQVKDATLPEDLFFDTLYHLTRRGQKINSQRLITALSARIHAPQPGAPH